jgi:hypothetical protein
VFPLKKQMFQTRQQLGSKIHQHPHSAYAEAMKEVFLKEHKCSSVGFHSDVYYVRAALEKKTGFVIPLFLIEAAMKKEGWKARKSGQQSLASLRQRQESVICLRRPLRH